LSFCLMVPANILHLKMNHTKLLAKCLTKLSLTKEAFDVRLVPFITAMYGQFQLDPEKFITANKKDIEKIDRIANGHYEFLNSGGEGSAWKIGNRGTYVLKITITPALNVMKDSGKITIHKEPTQDALDVSNVLWSKSPGARHEVMIRANGELQIIYHNQNRQPKRVWWKVIEYLDRSIIEDDSDSVDAMIGLILDRILVMANARREELGQHDSLSDFDMYSTDNAIIIGADNSSKRKELARELASDVRQNQETKQTIFDLGTDLSQGWLEDFIDGMLYLMAVRDKSDFIADNLGIRESTGRLVWFDP